MWITEKRARDFAGARGVGGFELFPRAEGEVHLEGLVAGEKLVAVEPLPVHECSGGELDHRRVDDLQVDQLLGRADPAEGEPLLDPVHSPRRFEGNPASRYLLH